MGEGGGGFSLSRRRNDKFNQVEELRALLACPYRARHTCALLAPLLPIPMSVPGCSPSPSRSPAPPEQKPLCLLSPGTKSCTSLSSPMLSLPPPGLCRLPEPSQSSV